MASPSQIQEKEVSLLPIRKTPPLPLRHSEKELEAISNAPEKWRRPANSEQGKFTPKQLSFINNIERGMSRKEAATAAGYAGGNDGSALYYTPHIFKEIQNRLRIHFEKENLATEEILARVSKCAHFNPLDFYDVKEDGSVQLNLKKPSRADMEAVQKIYHDSAGRAHVDFVPKAAYVALEAKLKGMITEKHEISGKDGGPVTVQYLDSIVQNVNITNIHLIEDPKSQELVEPKQLTLEGNIQNK